MYLFISFIVIIIIIIISATLKIFCAANMTLNNKCRK